jgi:hypothetical protein
MWSALFLSGALALGQPPTPPTTPLPSPVSVEPTGPVVPGSTEVTAVVQPALGQPPQAQTIEIPLPQLAPPAPAPVKPAAPATPADRWALMRLLQGTWYGAVLDDNRISISGWTEGSFTASTARVSQLPIGFNYRANEFLLQNNWLRVERTVDQGATTPTWGFRSDTILPGSDYRFTIARGLFSDQLTGNNGVPHVYGIDPVQFYG